MTTRIEQSSVEKDTFISAAQKHPSIGEVRLGRIESDLRRMQYEYYFPKWGVKVGEAKREAASNVISYLESPTVEYKFDNGRELRRWQHSMVDAYHDEDDEALDIFTRNQTSQRSITVALISMHGLVEGDETMSDEVKKELDVLGKVLRGEMRAWGRQIRYDELDSGRKLQELEKMGETDTVTSMGQMDVVDRVRRLGRATLTHFFSPTSLVA